MSEVYWSVAYIRGDFTSTLDAECLSSSSAIFDILLFACINILDDSPDGVYDRETKLN